MTIAQHLGGDKILKSYRLNFNINKWFKILKTDQIYVLKKATPRDPIIFCEMPGFKYHDNPAPKNPRTPGSSKTQPQISRD